MCQKKLLGMEKFKTNEYLSGKLTPNLTVIRRSNTFGRMIYLFPFRVFEAGLAGTGGAVVPWTCIPVKWQEKQWLDIFCLISAPQK